MTKIFVAILLALSALTEVRAAERYPFSLDTLLDDAKATRARGALRAPAQQCAGLELEKLTQEQYRSIRFSPCSPDIWGAEALPFRIELLPVGFQFQYHGGPIGHCRMARRRMWSPPT